MLACQNIREQSAPAVALKQADEKRAEDHGCDGKSPQHDSEQQRMQDDLSAEREGAHFDLNSPVALATLTTDEIAVCNVGQSASNDSTASLPAL